MTERWIEDTTKIGLREVGAVNTIIKREHIGWYIDVWEDDTIAGFVWQLPTRNGCPVYIIGFKDPWNDGPARIDTDFILGDRQAKGETEYTYTDEALASAAFQADSMAQYTAEAWRAESIKDQTEQRLNEIAEDLTQTRLKIRNLIHEIKALGTKDWGVPTLCETLRSAITNELRNMYDLRSERDDLLEKIGE